MSTNSAAVLTNLQGQQVTLTHVDINAEIVDLISHVSITQTYKNTEENNIEAVYTFPLPVDAVLLDLTVTLGDKVLKGQVVEKKQAEERYEDAITEGDSAIMLQETQSGMFTMNVGNLLAGESIVIEFSYGTLHQYQNKSLRFMLPTTIAPRYGNASQVGIEAHQTPEYSIASNYGFDFNLVVKGLLAKANIESPTHEISFEYVSKSIDLDDSTGRPVAVSLSKSNITMDRDFILNFTKVPVNQGSARVERDHHGYVALASFLCDFDIDEDRSPRSFKILVDCSGSMTGDSIKQARIAMEKMVLSLRDGDFINIIKFGSHHTMLAPEQVCVSQTNRKTILNYIEGIRADMGGTEMASALEATYQISQNLEKYLEINLEDNLKIKHDILLITDGEVWNGSDMILRAGQSQHRIFTIGVGSAVAENVVRGLADATGGVCELVTPNESMSDNIYRHFKRMYAPKAKSVAVQWPTEPTYSSPKDIKTVFYGDTLHAFAWFDDVPVGDVLLSITLLDGRVIEEKSTCRLLDKAMLDKTSENYSLTRMGISNSLRQNRLTETSLADKNTGETPLYQNRTKELLAVEYQLMTTWTNYLVIHERLDNEKAEALPRLRKIPKTLAAGWGGMGTVSRDVLYYSAPSKNMLHSSDTEQEVLEIPDFLRKWSDADFEFKTESKVDVESKMEVEITELCSSPHDEEANHQDFEVQLKIFIDNLLLNLSALTSYDFKSFGINGLQQLGLPEEVVNGFNAATEKYSDENLVMVVFLSGLLKSGLLNAWDRDSLRLIKWQINQVVIDEANFKEIECLLPDLRTKSIVS